MPIEVSHFRAHIKDPEPILARVTRGKMGKISICRNKETSDVLCNAGIF